MYQVAVLFVSLLIAAQAEKPSDRICAGARDGTRVLDNSNCAAYFTCQQNKLIDGHCESGMAMDFDSMSCVEASRSNCHGRPLATTMMRAANIPTSESLCRGRMDGILFPDALNCDAFSECQRGVAVRRTCAPGTLFDLNLYFCSPEHVVNCGTRRKPNQQRPSVTNRPNPGPNRRPPTVDEHHRVSCCFLTAH